jgi:hypothetical protein
MLDARLRKMKIAWADINANLVGSCWCKYAAVPVVTNVWTRKQLCLSYTFLGFQTVWIRQKELLDLFSAGSSMFRGIFYLRLVNLCKIVKLF